MEPKKKTGTLRALLLAVSAFAMLLTGVFVATSASATPEASNGCPEDFALAADGSSCFQLAQSQTTTTAPECAEGTMTPSGTHCYLPAVVTPQTRTDVVANVPNVPAPVYTCPAGSSGTGSGSSLTCSRTVDASTQVAVNVTQPDTIYTCPAGYSGTPVAGGSCTRTVTANSSVAVDVNVPNPIYSCPTGSSGTPVAGGTCTVPGTATETIAVNVTQPATTYSCPAGSSGTPVAGGTCTVPGTATETIAVNVSQAATTYSCPAGSSGTPVAGGTCIVPGSAIETAAPTCNTTTQTVEPNGCKTTGVLEVTCGGGDGVPSSTQTSATTSGGHTKCYPVVPPSTCPTTYTYNGTTCTRTVEANTTVAVLVNVPSPTYSCPTGYSGTPVAGGTCSRTVVANSTVAVDVTQPANTYSCPAGSSGTPVAGGTCTVPGTAQEAIAVNATVPSPVYTCPSGSSGSAVAGGTCTVPGTAQEAVVVNVSQAATTYSCPAGFGGTGSGASLTCSQTVAIDALVTCKNGTSPQASPSSEQVCIVGAASTSSATVAYCAKGVLSTDNTKCVLSAGATNSIAPAFTG